MNYYEYNDDVLNLKVKVCNFKTSYFVAEYAFHRNTIDELTTTLNSNETGTLIFCKKDNGKKGENGLFHWKWKCNRWK